MRIPVPVIGIDDASALRTRWLSWASMPAPTQDAMRDRERALHDAYVAAKADRLRHSWLYGFSDD
jgi:hypothetical protein